MSTVLLRDLVDLEWQLHRDAQGDPSELRERDRRIGAGLLAANGLDAPAARQRLSDRGFRETLSLGWLDRVRSKAAGLPGARLQQGFEITGWLLVVVGLVAGVGSARAFLAYDGKAPVNVLAFVAFFFGLQLLLLCLLVFVMLRHKSTGTGGVHRMLARLTRSRLVDRLLGKRVRGLGDVLDQLRHRRASFADAERWLLFSMVQRFGLSFNLGAVLACLYLVTFSDLVFAWSTTLAADANTIHGIVGGLALPWAWLGDWAVPSREVVAASQWARLTHSFVGDAPLASAIPLVARWWRFLVAGLIVYGLLPRTVAWLVGRRAYQRALGLAPLYHAGFQELYDRLLPSAIDWQGPTPDVVRSDRPSVVEQRAPLAVGNDVPVGLVLWGRLATREPALVKTVALRHPVRATYAAGGRDLHGDQVACDALSGDPPEQVLVLFEAGQQPTREVLDFLADIRSAIGQAKPLLIGLTVEGEAGCFRDAPEAELAVWRRALASAGDAYARVRRITA